MMTVRDVYASTPKDAKIWVWLKDGDGIHTVDMYDHMDMEVAELEASDYNEFEITIRK